jgi:GNAT superfamily N-acetyltransferase
VTSTASFRVSRSRAANSKLLTSARRDVSHPRPPDNLTALTNGDQASPRSNTATGRDHTGATLTNRADVELRMATKFRDSGRWYAGQRFGATMLASIRPLLADTGRDIAHEFMNWLVLDGPWVDQLYVEPTLTGRGVGAGLLRLAKRERPDGLRLWTFASNTGAQRFYESHEFVATRRTDGRDNEERAPDILYVWHGERVTR